MTEWFHRISNSNFRCRFFYRQSEWCRCIAYTKIFPCSIISLVYCTEVMHYKNFGYNHNNNKNAIGETR